MNYDLALRLKEAGFKCAEYVTPMYFDTSLPIGEADLPNPTSDELIEALGDRFWAIMKIDDRFICGGGGEGKTPIEALAELYISINKK